MRLLECAKIVTTHGIKGEVKIQIITDDLSRFEPNTVLYLGEEKKEIVINSFRPFQKMGLITFNNITNINDVLQYVGKTIYVDVDTFDTDDIYYDDLIGCNVYEEDVLIGEIIDILEVPQGEILTVKKVNGGNALIPYVDEFIVNVDIENKRVDIHTIEGLL